MITGASAIRFHVVAKLQAAADEIIANAPPEYVRLLVGGLLIVTRRKCRRFKNFAAVEQAILQKVKTTMNFITQIILEDPDIAQLVARKVAEGKAEGKIEGETRGKIEGKAEGKIEGWRDAVAATWEDRFGVVPDDVAAAIAKLDVPALRPMMFLLMKATEAEARLALDV
jgi:hypothetical protein